MICKHCGAEIDTRVQRTDGLLVCPECGAMYRRKQSSAADNASSHDIQIIRKDDRHAVQSSATDKPIRKSKTILLVIFPVIAICIIFAIFLYNKPAATILRRNNTISNFSASWCYFVVGEPEEVTFFAEARKAPILFR